METKSSHTAHGTPRIMIGARALPKLSPSRTMRSFLVTPRLRTTERVVVEQIVNLTLIVSTQPPLAQGLEPWSSSIIIMHALPFCCA